MQLESVKADAKMAYLKEEVRLKKELMQFEFDLNEALRNQERSDKNNIEIMKEQGKNKRENTKRFESSGNDILGGGIGLDDFTPQVGN